VAFDPSPALGKPSGDAHKRAVLYPPMSRHTHPIRGHGKREMKRKRPRKQEGKVKAAKNLPKNLLPLQNGRRLRIQTL